MHNPIYSAADLPPAPKRFSAPSPPTPNSSSGEEHDWDGSDRIPMSINVLKEICKGRDLNSLPAEVRAVLAGEEGFRQTSNPDNSTEGATPVQQMHAPQLDAKQLSPDLLQPQIERLVDKSVETGTNQTTTPTALVTTDPGRRMPSQRIQILKRSADLKLKGKSTENETGHDESASQLATFSTAQREKAVVPRETSRPRVTRQSGGIQIGDGSQKPLHRTEAQKSSTERQDALPHTPVPLVLTGQSATPINSPYAIAPKYMPHQTPHRSYSRRDIPSKEKSSLTSGKVTPGGSISREKPNVVSKGLNTCLQILSQEISSSSLKRKSMGRILIPNRPEPEKKYIQPVRPCKDSSITAALNPDGYYNVRVEQAFCAELGQNCGFKATDVANFAR